ncbi:hypothetical protein [Paraburkholderia sp. MM5482-R1]|uniref:hypothetical protein n=1 Tax=Paraburkholderia sp. MM5482-R1 TaxID=2991063 RepID=UPI003D1D4D98
MRTNSSSPNVSRKRFSAPLTAALTEKQPLRGTRDAALFEQRAEGQQQVQVEAPKIIFNDVGHDIKRFE